MMQRVPSSFQQSHRRRYIRAGLVLSIMLVTACAGSKTTPDPFETAIAAPSRPVGARSSSTGVGAPPAARTAPTDNSDPISMEAFEVRGSAFNDFGMSVRTNFEVEWGGAVDWMQVSGVQPDSSASTQRIAVGDRVLAVDGTLIKGMGRDEMLERLFQRKKGERSRFLILSRRRPLPHFVILTASRPDGI